ncbi:hypothetical protein DCAR_0415158 [Daucus carota subsp. sativus]|uniref:Uncharacterized protein n=1 Tax=Daucus carota subsp. sativus TaxID=79200 RepID=A0AAF0WUP0_DAUCS|nr:hypothetical protein DCAR_0415158 [Daucus carota subsp. sativus]
MRRSGGLRIFLTIGLISEIFQTALSAQLSTKNKVHSSSYISYNSYLRNNICLYGNCSYAVTVETTCTRGAETSNHVSLRFGDAKSNDILPQVLDDIPRKPFQACMVDQFQVTGPCVESMICYLYLKLNGNDDWRPGFVQVKVFEGSHFSSDYFYVRRYLPRHVWHGSDMCETEVTPFGVKYKRKVLGKKHA